MNGPEPDNTDHDDPEDIGRCSYRRLHNLKPGSSAINSFAFPPDAKGSYLSYVVTILVKNDLKYVVSCSYDDTVRV